MTAHITVIGGTKGGSGKSTISVNVAVMLSLMGRDVLLIDADEQKSSKNFTDLRNDQREGGAGYTCISLTGKAVRTETARLSEKYDEIIIDCGGRDTASQRAALTIAHTLVIPWQPSTFDMWTDEDVTNILFDVGAVNPDLDVISFINRAETVGSDNDDARAMLSESEVWRLIDAQVGSRKAFKNAAALGLSVTEMKRKDPKAIAEIRNLFDLVFLPRLSNVIKLQKVA